MCPDPRPGNVEYHRARARSQSGFSIVSAIFLLVVLAALGAAMVTFSTAQHTAANQDLDTIKAYQAARAGIEWGLYQALTPGTAPASSVCTGTLPSLGGNLSGFTVNVLCSRNTVEEGGANVEIYQITSTATKGTANTIQFVERELQVTASR